MFKTSKKKGTDRSNLYPLLGSDYISPKLLQYVTQLHSRSRQDSITHTLDKGEALHNHQTHPNMESNTELTNIESGYHKNIEEQTPSATQELIPLSPHLTREIILKNKNNNKASHTYKQNNNTNKTPIQEEWILPDEILPDKKWELKSIFESKSKQNKNGQTSSAKLSQSSK